MRGGSGNVRKVVMLDDGGDEALFGGRNLRDGEMEEEGPKLGVREITQGRSRACPCVRRLLWILQ